MINWIWKWGLCMFSGRGSLSNRYYKCDRYIIKNAHGSREGYLVSPLSYIFPEYEWMVRYRKLRGMSCKVDSIKGGSNVIWGLPLFGSSSTNLSSFLHAHGHHATQATIISCLGYNLSPLSHFPDFTFPFANTSLYCSPKSQTESSQLPSPCM